MTQRASLKEVLKCFYSKDIDLRGRQAKSGYAEKKREGVGQVRLTRVARAVCLPQVVGLSRTRARTKKKVLGLTDTSASKAVS